MILDLLEWLGEVVEPVRTRLRVAWRKLTVGERLPPRRSP